MAEQKALALINGKVSEIPIGDTIRGAGSGGAGFQKYYVGVSETYTIPQFYSSVITGPMEILGIVVVDGRLEIL